MSRIGNKPVKIKSGVEVSVKDRKVECKGPKGTLSFEHDDRIKVDVKDDQVIIKTDNDKDIDIETNALWGTTRALIDNMITGVTDGFEKKLEINGVGYNAKVAGKKVELNLGYSHSIELDIPEGLEVKVEKNIVTISGIDKQSVGQFAAIIRSHRKPEPYKGKGIKYIDEHIRRKAGKKAVATEGGE